MVDEMLISGPRQQANADLFWPGRRAVLLSE